MRVYTFISAIFIFSFLNHDFRNQVGFIEKFQNDTIITADTSFVNLRNLSDDFVYDMKYASIDNFLETNVYECDSCFLRMATARALISANEDFRKMGYKIKIYDCYRPLDIQKKMWKIVPDARYVANPEAGSIHNRGGAVDITLVNEEGTELDMGTKFDFFGAAAAHNYKKLKKQVLENRLLLKSVMMENGFSPIKSEWWHYNLNTGKNFKVSNHKWICE